MFPSSIPIYNGFTSSHTLAQDTHAAQHDQEQADITALATKLGTGASTPVANTVLRGNGTGTSSYAALKLSTDVTGVLQTQNGGTGTTSATGSGDIVFDDSPDLTTPGITTPSITDGGSWTGAPAIDNADLTSQPSISDFTNATHDHSDAVAGGSTLDSPTIVTPTIAQINNASTPGVKLQLETQTDNSNSITSALTAAVYVQVGWGQVVGGGAATLTDSVTFPTSFSTVLGVAIAPLGISTPSAATDITGLTQSTSTTSGLVVATKSITTSGFTADLGRSTGTFSSSNFYGYSWIAWGT